MVKDVLTEVINDWDPLNLFPSAPDDEYELEINKVFAHINEDLEGIPELAQTIQDVFTKAFSTKFDYEKCLTIANRILAKISRESTQLSNDIWLSIPFYLKLRGYYSLDEVAWWKEDAIKVINHIFKRGQGILGIDVWLPTKPGPTIPEFGVDLKLGDLNKSDWHKYIMECNTLAISFIECFMFSDSIIKKYPGYEPVFNIWDFESGKK